MIELHPVTLDSEETIYDDKENIQDPVNNNQNQQKEIKLRPVEIPVEEPTVQEKLPVSKDKPIELHPVTDLNPVTPEEDSIPELQSIRQEKDPIKKIENVDNELEKLNRQRADLIKHEPMRRNINGEIIMGPGEEKRQSDLAEVEKKITGLRTERIQITHNEIDPVDSTTKKDIGDATLFDGTINSVKKFSNAVFKYGEKKIDRVESDELDKAYSDYEQNQFKTALAEKNPDKLWNWNTIKYADRPKLDPRASRDIQKIFETSEADPMFYGHGKSGTFDFNTKAKVIQKNLNEYIDKHYPDITPEAKEKKIIDYTQWLVPSLAFGNKGEGSPAGLKMNAANELVKLQDRHDELTQIKEKLDKMEFNRPDGDKGPWDEATPELTKQSYESFQAYKERIKKKYDLVTRAMDFNLSILKTPEQRRGIRDFATKGGLGYPNAKDLISMNISEMQRTLNVAEISKKVENHEDLSWEEKQIMDQYATLQSLQSLGTVGTFAQVGAGITAMAPYMASFAFSGGAFTAGEKLAQKGIETGAEKLISAGARKSLTSALTYHLPNFSKAARVLGQAKFSIPEMATKAASFTAGSIAQTLVLPQYYVKNIAERTIPNMQHILTPDMKDLVTQIDANTGDKLGSAIWKGGTDAFWEISTERLGRDLLKLSKIPGRAINSALGRDVPKQIIAEEFMKLKGFKSVPELMRHVQENVLGWHGIKEEYFEELVNQLGSMATSGDKTTLPDFLNNQITTFLTVGIFGGGMSVGEYGMKHIRYGSIGDNTVYVSQSQKQGKQEIARIQGLLDKNPGSEELKRQLASAKGKKEKIYIPNVIHDKLLKIFNDYDNIDESGLANLITQVQSDKDPEKRLSDRQVKFILDLAIQEGARKNERNAVINSIKKSGIMTTDLFVTPEYDSTKDYDQLLTEEDMNNIQKKNELIKKRYQGLDEMDLLERDNTGQLIEPDIDYLTELKSQLEEENKQASKQKADGTYELHDQSAIKEIDKEIAQLQEAQKKGPLQSITDRIDKLTREKAHIATTLPYEAVVLNRKIQEVDSELNKLADQEDVGFAFMKPSEKQKILQDELRMKNPLEGHIDPISNKQLLVTLDDGRQVIAFMGPHEGKGETPADYKNRGVLMMDTWQNKKKVTLKLVPKAEWNADDEAHEIYKDSRGISYKIPYGDKIDVQVDGKTIASVQVHDYNEKQILEAKFNKAKELFKARMGELTMRLVNKTGGVATIMSLNDGEKIDFLKDIVNSIVEMTKVKASQAMAWVKQLIAESDLLQKDKDDLTSLAELNEGNIMRHVMSAKLAAQGKAKKVVPLDLQSMVFENSESVALSSGDKINSQLKTFAPLWVSIAEEHELSKEEVELAFLGISKLNMDAVRNDDTFHAWLMSQRTGDKATDAILSRFLSISWSQALSFFDFYSNVVLAKQYGMYYTKRKGMEFKLLNPSEQYGEMTSIFNKNLRTFTAKELRTKVKAYADQVNKDFQMYRTLDAKGKYDLKKAQFAKDLQFLYEVTGIPAEVWSNYFSEQTKETYQYTKKGDPRATNFKTMENLFKEEPLRLNGDPWRQSNLMMNLLFGSMQSKYKKDVEAGVLQDVAFMKHFKNYFLKGEGKSLSNLFKLSTSVKGANEVGLSGQDIKSDQFSSFIQYSDISNTAENILTSTLNNPLVAYYKAQGKAIDLVLLNGIHNLSKNRAKKGTSSINMSMEDLWVSLISLYQQGTGSYMHSLGQFKDKPTIYLMEAPKVDKPTAEQIKHLDKIFGLDNFNNTVNYLLDNIVEFNQDIFAKGEATNEMIRGFVYNYAVNTLNSNQIFFGEQTKESYPKGILSLVKRAGSSNSPGYRLNRFTEGGIGKSFRFAIANDKSFIDHLGNKLTAEAFDGMIFMSGDTARKMQVSMGSIYSKQNEYPILDSVKAVISYKDPGTNTRGLTKPNIINIDIASETGSPTYKAIQDYMKKNKIDVLSFTSSSKIIAKEKVINLFNEDGSFNAGAEAIHGTHVTDMNTNNLYVQQDLRHAITPKSTKMPAPFLANMMSLPNGKSIAGMISEMQRLGIENLERDLSKTDIDIAKKAWLEENVNKFSQPDLKRLLKAGLTIDDPTYRKMMQTILTAAISRRALEIPINRVTTQEIPDVDGILMPYTPAKDGKHTLLAEVITGVEGGREHNYKYEGKVKEAIQYVKDNPEEFADLFDLAGNLMEWEITDRNGVIPGEVIILNRVPAHALVSHHVARLKKNLPVNFTMINKKSQLASGSDSDGDQRYNQVFYRNGEGKILLGEPESAILGYTEEEIANRIMMLVAEDYTDIANFDAIDRPIDKGAYDATVNRIREADKRTFKSIDPRAFEEARLNNIVGVLMKGILTDHNTIFSIISRYNMFFKVKKNLVFETDETEVEGSVIIKNIRLDQIAKDAYGAIKAHIGNFQNLAFDNADDPKIETLGYNEVTANMFTLALIGDNRNSSSNFRSFEEHYEYIKSAIDRQADYFTSPLVRQFTSMVRRNNGGMRNEDIKVVFTKLTSGAKSGKWTEQDVKNLKALYYAGNEILDFGKLYSLTQEAPKTFADFLMARDLVERVKNNKMSILDTRSLFVIENGNAEFVRELRIIDKVMEIAEDYIFEDSVEQTPVGMRIRDYVLSQMQKNDPKKKKLSKPELESISSAINAVFNIRMIHESRSFDQLNKEILSRFPALKEEYKDNPFFKYLDIIENDDAQNEKFRSEVRVIPEYAQAGFRENVLSTIREGFSKLPSDIKGLFAAYTLSRFGASTLVRNGGFYSFLDDKSRVKMSKMASDEMEQWYFDELSPMEQLNIANWVLKISKNEAIKKLAAIPSEDRIIDINRDSTTQSSLHRDAIEGLYDVNDIDQFLSWENQYDPTKVLRTAVENKHKVPIESRLQETIQPYRNFRDNLLAIANKHFPQTPQDPEIHNYTPMEGEIMYRGFNPVFYDVTTLRNILSNKFREGVNESDLIIDSSISNHRSRGITIGNAKIGRLITENSLLKDREGNLWAVESIESGSKLRGEDALYYYEDGLDPSQVEVFNLIEVEIVNGHIQDKYYEHEALTRGPFETEFHKEIVSDPNFAWNIPSDRLVEKGFSLVGEFNSTTPEQLALPGHVVENYNNSPVGHALLSNDPNLVPFIYNHLQKQYPGIRIFVNRQAFYAFVAKNGGRMLDVNPTRIGHAFKNAIFIDPTKSIQDVLFHEHAHIYWDALPDQHPAKNRLRSLYAGQTNIDEKIIMDIGRAGTDIGNTFLNGNLYDKFLLYLKDFWRSVKSVFGIYSNTDLVTDLAWAIWTNQDSIKPTTAQGEAEIKNFEQYDYTDKQIDRDKAKHTVTIGGKQIYGVNTMIKRKENSKFDPDERLSERSKRFQAAYKEITGKNPTSETLWEEEQAIQLEWNDKTIAGSAIHSIAEEVFSGKTIAPEHLARFAPTVADQLRRSMVRLKNEILAKYPEATFLTEQDLISTKYMIFGVADLLVDIGNNKILVFDFKTTSSHYKTPEGKLTPQYRMSYGLMKSPLQNIHQSKQTSHTLQLRTYAQIIEEQENKNSSNQYIEVETNGLTPEEQKAVDFVNSLNEWQQHSPQFGLDKQYKLAEKLADEGKVTRKIIPGGVYGDKLRLVPIVRKKSVLKSAKNEVVGLYVVPILRQLDGNGKIILAEISQVVVPAETEENQSPVANIWDNLIDVPYERGFVDGLLKDNLGFTQGFTDKYVSFKNHLDKTQFPEALKDELLSAYSYISNIAGDDLARMSYIALEDMRGDSLNGIVSQLIALDFTRDDMSTIPFEAMLNIAKNNITKERWEAEKDVLFSLQKVGSNKVKKINPKRITNTWYHKTFAFEDHKINHYFHEAGTKTLKLNDLVIQIYSVKGSSGKVYEDYSYARVTKINKKIGVVHLKDEESGQTFQVGNVEDSEGILKVLVNDEGEEFNNDGSQVTPIPEREVTPNNYVPRYLDIEEDVFERHWNFPFVRKQAESTAEGKAEERSHLHSQRLLWKWFNEYQRIKDIRGFIDNQDATAELYHNIASFESDVSFTLVHFLQETLLNHYQATQIRIEHAQGPSINMPMTLNTFYMLIRPEKAFIDFRGIWRSAYYLMPARLLEAKSTGANFILMGMENALRKIGEDQFELNQKMEKYFNHVNLDDITRTIRGRKFYRTPDMEEFKESEISKIKNEIRKERKRMARLALETIYQHYYKYDYKYIAAKQRAEKQGIRGYPLQIPVSKFFSTQRELANIENSKGEKPIGRKWAAILHYLMKPGLYDDIKLMTDQLDSKGKPKIMTFADIKDSFALENATDAEIQEWMGTRKKILGMYFSRHSFIKMPVIRKYISAGKLYNYYKKAADIYIHGDENNVKSVRKGNRITTLGNRRVRYNTGHLLEAETKVMESNIAAMYLKRLAAPLDYIKAHYDKDTEAFKYIKDLTDFLVYKKSPALGTEWSAMVDYLARATSLSRIAWSPKTNIMNLVIGQVMDNIREPEAYLKGVKRFFTDHKKAIAILKRYQLANITDEARFDELAKAIGTKVTINGQEHLLSWDAFMDMGYLPMEWAEKANQLPIFIGLMTDEEFNSYDDTGKIIDKDRALSMNRKILLSDMVRDIHGDYGPQNAAPFWNTNWGKALLQFKKYYPATLFAEFSPYHLDRQYIVRSGIMPTMSFIFRMAKYNMSSSSTQYKRIKEAEKIIQQKIKEGNLDHVFFKNTKEYFQQFLAAREEGNIQWKELSDNDKKNAVSFVLQMTILSSLILAKLAIAGGSGKDKKQLDANMQWWWQTLNRVQTDIFFYTNNQNMSNLIKTPTAMLNTAIAMGQTVTQVGEWMFYSAKRGELYPNEVQQKKDTPYLLEGEPKIIKSLIGWVPLGGALSSALTWRMWFYNNQNFINWMNKQGVDPNIVESVKNMFTVEKGKQKVSDEANQYDAIMKEYILYQMGESMSGEELSAYGAMMNYYKEMMQNVTDAEKSIMLEQLKDVIMQGDPKFLDKMHEKAVDVTNTLDKNKYRSLKKKKSYYDETQLELNKK